MRKASCLQHRLVPWVMVLVLTLFAVACNEHLLEPEAANEALSAAPSDGEVAASKKGAKKCPQHVDFVVTDEASFLAALGAASPGDVIGVDGMIEITAEVEIMTENLTVTCATPGSGFFAGAGVRYMLDALANGVTVKQLVLDASGARGPYLAYNDGGAYTAEDVRFSNNTVLCGETCATIVGVKGAVLVGNTFEAEGAGGGLQIVGNGPRGPDGMSEWPTDGTRVQRNTIIATTPSTFDLVGGIRVRDGRNIEISKNIVRGPWLNGMSLDNIYESRIRQNRVKGAVNFGIATGLVSDYNVTLIIRNNVFRNNRVTDVRATSS